MRTPRPPRRGGVATAESLPDQFIAKLECAANDDADDGKKSKLKHLAEFFATGGRDLLVDITGS